MQKKYSNKMMGTGDSTPVSETNTTGSNKTEFHFPGGLEYKPCSVKAKDRTEAEKKWKQKREKIV